MNARPPEAPWRRLWDSLFALVRRWGKQINDAEDIASEVVVRTLLHFGRAVPWCELWAWAVRTARNLFVSLWRLSQREVIADAEVESLLDGDRTADQAVFTDLCDRLEEQLSGAQRESFRLLLAGLSIEEAAVARGISSRACRACREEIREKACRTVGNDARQVPFSARPACF